LGKLQAGNSYTNEFFKFLEEFQAGEKEYQGKFRALNSNKNSPHKGNIFLARKTSVSDIPDRSLSKL
jgi:hypothetical protein